MFISFKFNNYYIESIKMSETYFDKKYLPPDLKTSNLGDRERNNQNLMPNSKMDSGPLLLNNFLPSENNDSIE